MRNPFREETFMEAHGTKVFAGIAALAIIGGGYLVFNSDEEEKAAKKEVEDFTEMLTLLVEYSKRDGAITIGSEEKAMLEQFQSGGDIENAKKFVKKGIEMFQKRDYDILINQIRSVMKPGDELTYNEENREILVNGESHGIFGVQLVGETFSASQKQIRIRVCEKLNEISDKVKIKKDVTKKDDDKDCKDGKCDKAA